MYVKIVVQVVRRVADIGFDRIDLVEGGIYLHVHRSTNVPFPLRRKLSTLGIPFTSIPFRACVRTLGILRVHTYVKTL